MKSRSNAGSFLIFFNLILFILSCSPKLAPTNTAETQFIESAGEGLVTVESVGYGEDFAAAAQDAVQRSFKTIMLRGLPQFTALSRPLIADEAALNSKKPNFLNSFFSNQEYSKFITAQNDGVLTGEFKNPKGKRVNKSVTINYAGLRRYLEQEGAARKFGYK